MPGTTGVVSSWKQREGGPYLASVLLRTDPHPPGSHVSKREVLNAHHRNSPLSLECWEKELHKSKSLITVLHLTQANPI